MSGLGGVLAILMLLQYAEAQTVYVVGDGTGWRVPQDASTYQNWASDKNFTVGDILTFNFQTGQHNVIEVSEGSYNSCSSSNPTGTIFSSSTNITLNRGGQHYYICGVGQHCINGQRLAINVSGSPSDSPPSSAVPPAATTAPPPPSSSARTHSATFIPFLFSAFMIIAF